MRLPSSLIFKKPGPSSQTLYFNNSFHPFGIVQQHTQLLGSFNQQQSYHVVPQEECSDRQSDCFNSIRCSCSARDEPDLRSQTFTFGWQADNVHRYFIAGSAPCRPCRSPLGDLLAGRGSWHYGFWRYTPAVFCGRGTGPRPSCSSSWLQRCLAEGTSGLGISRQTFQLQERYRLR